MTQILCLHLLPSRSLPGAPVDGEPYLRSTGTTLSRVQVQPPAPWPDGGPENLEITLVRISYIEQKNTISHFLSPTPTMDSEKWHTLMPTPLQGRRETCSLQYSVPFIEIF
ncbi:hypothetical protein PoB_007455700 [Plakobranchus ocellatus]|uniref:Uncharacterized protein n=1 Tax=Plakobranchus ocellatus TaxID=259542 RepID=A0AAV4DVM1_9GAST|nr:hypothetical protein PoB_007455700 [Plakobranchus ocellatus]